MSRSLRFVYNPTTSYKQMCMYVCVKIEIAHWPRWFGASLRSLVMNGKFGGKQPTGTPSMAWSTVVVVFSLLSGASVVHNIFKPDLTLTPIDTSNEAKKQHDLKD